MDTEESFAAPKYWFAMKLCRVLINFMETAIEKKLCFFNGKTVAQIRRKVEAP